MSAQSSPKRQLTGNEEIEEKVVTPDLPESDVDHDYGDPSSEEESEIQKRFYEYEFNDALKAWDKHIENVRREWITTYMESQRKPSKCINCRATIPWNQRYCDEECQYENAHKDPGY